MGQSRFDRDEVWVPIEKWAQPGSWRARVQASQIEQPEWSAYEPPRKDRALAVMVLLWLFVPCLLLGWYYHDCLALEPSPAVQAVTQRACDTRM